MPRAAELTGRRTQLPVIDVVVGVIPGARDRVLIAQRPDGKHLAGCWEFPGGKLEANESPLRGLCREIVEEIGVEVQTAEPLLQHRHSYPDRIVQLDVWWVLSWSGEPQSREGQQLRWVDAAQLQRQEMLPADQPLVAAVCARLDSA